MVEHWVAVTALRSAWLTDSLTDCDWATPMETRKVTSTVHLRGCYRAAMTGNWMAKSSVGLKDCLMETRSGSQREHSKVKMTAGCWG